jgi:polar amino acid transport system substrate-binding protein
MLNNAIIAFLLFTLFSFKLSANHTDITVGLEPFPPLVNEDGSGFVINMLNALQKNSTLNFNFQIMTYARAKKELRNQRIDMVGLTPKDSETQKFYQYAQELVWHFDTTVDFYSTSPTHFKLENLPNQSIGTLIGNADFFSELAGISIERFIEVSSLTQLIMMMARGRIKVVLFERVAMMSTINKLQNDLRSKVPSEFNSPESPQKIYYKKFKIIAASLAVAKNEAGDKLKTQLDELLTKNTRQYFKKIAPYAKLPDTGVVESYTDIKTGSNTSR